MKPEGREPRLKLAGVGCTLSLNEKGTLKLLTQTSSSCKYWRGKYCTLSGVVPLQSVVISMMEDKDLRKKQDCNFAMSVGFKE